MIVLGGLAASMMTGMVPMPFHRSTPTPTAHPTPTPTPTPWPNIPPAPGTIPNLSMPHALALAKQWGLDCSSTYRDASGINHFCEKKDRLDRRLLITSDDDIHVKYVRAAVVYADARADRARSAAFLGDVAGLPYAGADSPRASDWVNQNLDGGTIVIGGVTFRTVAQPTVQRWQLEMLIIP